MKKLISTFWLAAVLCGGILAAEADAQARAENPQPRAKVAPAVPAAPVVADVAPVPEAKPVHMTVADVLAAKLAKATAAEVPRLLEVALAKATEADAPAIAAAVYARLVALTVKGVDPVVLAKIQAEWYERLKATPSSKAWWILRVAKERAERGESVEKLKDAFDATMRAWLAEEE